MIYRRVVSQRYHWISLYDSPEHVYMECYWCKKKMGVACERGGYITKKALTYLKLDFYSAHRECTDRSIQLEMFTDDTLQGVST